MLSEENKAQLKKAIKSIGQIIKGIGDIPVDPRAMMLLDIAASYLEEQRENSIEYTESSFGSIDDDELEDDSIKAEHGEDNFKLLKDIDIQNPPAIPSMPTKTTLGDMLGDEIQKWYEEQDSSDHESE